MGKSNSPYGACERSNRDECPNYSAAASFDGLFAIACRSLLYHVSGSGNSLKFALGNIGTQAG
jgi:hypothetical protein